MPNVAKPARGLFRIALDAEPPLIDGDETGLRGGMTLAGGLPVPVKRGGVVFLAAVVEIDFGQFCLGVDVPRGGQFKQPGRDIRCGGPRGENGLQLTERVADHLTPVASIARFPQRAC
ncbi:hypothetical protein D9M70_487470 [compost metagenome]